MFRLSVTLALLLVTCLLWRESAGNYLDDEGDTVKNSGNQLTDNNVEEEEKEAIFFGWMHPVEGEK